MNGATTDQHPHDRRADLPDRATPRLQVRALSLSYGDRRVLDGVDLDVAEGEFVSLIGPSGCGKTTLLNLVAGFRAPTSGSITLAGRLVERPGADRAMVFQDDAVFPWATVLDNVAYGLRVRGLSKAHRHERARELVRLVGLEGRERAYPRELSGGMRKRVDVARALALDPEVLLMDEPFAALDAITKERLQEEFLRICEARGITVLFVTHDIEEALFLSDRIALMGLGGELLDEVAVKLPRPRTAEMRTSPRLQELRGELVATLRTQA